MKQIKTRHVVLGLLAGGGALWGLHEFTIDSPEPTTQGTSPIIGSWMVNGHACGMGIREDEGPITGNTSWSIPHLIEN